MRAKRPWSWRDPGPVVVPRSEPQMRREDLVYSALVLVGDSTTGARRIVHVEPGGIVPITRHEDVVVLSPGQYIEPVTADTDIGSQARPFPRELLERFEAQRLHRAVCPCPSRPDCVPHLRSASGRCDIHGHVDPAREVEPRSESDIEDDVTTWTVAFSLDELAEALKDCCTATGTREHARHVLNRLRELD